MASQRAKIFLPIFFFGWNAFSFPEMIRHGYINCTSCHVSPNGGSQLTDYGRQLSGEVLSTDYREHEGDFLYGVIHTPEVLNFGGDFRGLQFHQDTEAAIDGRFIPMQADLTAAVVTKSVYGEASVGLSPNRNPKTVTDRLMSRTHYVGTYLGDEVSVRAGRFAKAFGVNLADHAVSTKRDLGWDEGTESYNVEAAYLGEKYDLFVTGEIASTDTSGESGIALRGSRNIGDTMKVGLSYFYGTSPTGVRHVAGPYAILGVTKRLVLIIESDLQQVVGGNLGSVSYLKQDYEIMKGLHVFASEQFTKLAFSAADQTNAGQLGVQFFPRPHIDTMLFAEEDWAVPSSNSRFLAGLMLHFYL